MRKTAGRRKVADVGQESEQGRAIGEEPLLEVEKLSVSFEMYDIGADKKRTEALCDLTIHVNAGEIVAAAGSSGSGKSLLAHSILGILPANARQEGVIKFQGRKLDQKTLKKLSGREIAFIPQSVEYLDPLMKAGKQALGVRNREKRGWSSLWDKKEKERRRQLLAEIFTRYRLPKEAAQMYPCQLSGGMARRVLIAGAVINGAQLLIADEPTPGLDAELAKETISDFRKLADDGCGILLITHDIDLACQAADRIAFFYGGTVVETAPASDFCAEKCELRHPYSKAMFHALPQHEFQSPGEHIFAGNLSRGCFFAEYCPHKTWECEGDIPMRKLRGGEVRCIHAT